MSTPFRRRTFVAGALLVLLVNALMLGTVAWNRGGDADAVLTLSARELQLPWGAGTHSEDSGVGFLLQWRVTEIAPPPGQPETPSPWTTGIDWLDGHKMAELGFAVPAAGEHPGHESRFARQGARAVLLVLELDGPAYAASLQRTRDALAMAEQHAAAQPGDTPRQEDLRVTRERLQHEENLASRLFVVDAGLALPTLRARWPDRRRHAIVPGLVTAVYVEDTRGDVVRGFVSGPLVTTIHVPSERRDEVLAGWPPAGMAEAGSARAEVAFGRRLEPWLRGFRAGR